MNLPALLSLLLLSVFVGACQSTPPAPPPRRPDAWAIVDGREIKQDEVEKAYRRSNQANATPSEDEATVAKLSVLNDLIVQDILLTKAQELKIEVPDTELDTAYAEARKDIPRSSSSRSSTAATSRRPTCATACAASCWPRK